VNELIKVQSTRQSVAIVDYWPHLQNAETECILRLRAALESLCVDVVVINRHGFLVSDLHTHVDELGVRFVLALHFDSAKCWSAYTYCALWNPLDFFFQWSYRNKTNNLLSHDAYLSCGSQVADDHVKRALVGVGRDAPLRMQTLFHGVHQPVIAPSVGRCQLFYCGINWEAISGAGGRHHDLLKKLDRDGLIDIYGPEVFQGVQVWRGYDAYLGEIPFDGESLIKKVAESGIGLVLSSKAHINSGLMSSRLFEALAAGVPIICDENPFARKYLDSTLLYVDSTASPSVLAEQIKVHVNWIKSNPTKAIKLATDAQKIYTETLSLVGNLTPLLADSPPNQVTLEIVSTVALYTLFIAPVWDQGLLRRLRVFSAQFKRMTNFHLLAVVPANWLDVRLNDIRAACPNVVFLYCECDCNVFDSIMSAALKVVCNFVASVDSSACIQLVPPWEEPFGLATIEMWGLMSTDSERCSVIGGFTSKAEGIDASHLSAQFYAQPAHESIFDVNREFSLSCMLVRAGCIFNKLNATLTYAPHLCGRAIYLACLRHGIFQYYAKATVALDHDHYVRNFRSNNAELIAREAEIVIDMLGREFFLQTIGSTQGASSSLGGAQLAPEQFIGLLKTETSRLLLLKLFDALLLPTFLSKRIKWLWRKIAL
jgi:hypothetical protein